MAPRPNAWNRLRSAISRFIHHKSDDGLFCCASTLTASKWYSGSMITGR